MNRTPIRVLAAVAALVLLPSAASGDVNRSVLDARYAEFKSRQSWRWTWDALLAPVTSAATRVLRHTVRPFAGTVNPYNIPAFGDDFDERRPQVAAQIGIPAAHGTSTGADVVVAVLDSGFNLQHPMIAGRVLPYGFDPVGHDWDPQDRGNGIDDDGDGVTDAGVGHGTFVAGTILHAAPGAWIVPVRIADDEGYGLEVELLQGIDYAISMGVDVINLSYEAGAITIAVRDKLRQAAAAGIVVVVSVGNDGAPHAKTLANEGTTISVGAVDDDDAVAPFSNLPADGVGITLFAPGVDLWGPHGGPSNDACCTWSGTSFAAPLVTGAVCLALQLEPALTNAQVRSRLLGASTAPVTTSTGAVYPYAGRLHLAAVVDP